MFPSEYPFKPPGIKVRRPCSPKVLIPDRFLADVDTFRKIFTRQEDLLFNVRFPPGNCKLSSLLLAMSPLMTILLRYCQWNPAWSVATM
jgi:hypothetical protein